MTRPCPQVHDLGLFIFFFTDVNPTGEDLPAIKMSLNANLNKKSGSKDHSKEKESSSQQSLKDENMNDDLDMEEVEIHVPHQASLLLY